MTGQILKRWTDDWYVDEEGPSSIFKIEAVQEKMFIVFNLRTSFKLLKRRRNLVKYLTPSGSLTLNIDLLLGLIKERSLFLKTTVDSEFCISGASCDHSGREFEKKRIFETVSSAIEKRFLFVAYIIKPFTRWYNIEKVLRALSWQ